MFHHLTDAVMARRHEEIVRERQLQEQRQDAAYDDDCRSHGDSGYGSSIRGSDGPSWPRLLGTPTKGDPGFRDPACDS